MADILPLDRGIFQDTCIVALGQSVSALQESFRKDPDLFMTMVVEDATDADRNLWAEEALDEAAKQLRILVSKIRIERIRNRHRGDAA